MDKEIENILKAKPVHDKGTDEPFRMPKSPHLWIFDEFGRPKIIVQNLVSE